MFFTLWLGPFLPEKLLKYIFSSPGNCPGWTVIGNFVCVVMSVCLYVNTLCSAHRQDGQEQKSVNNTLYYTIWATPS